MFALFVILGLGYLATREKDDLSSFDLARYYDPTITPTYHADKGGPIWMYSKSSPRDQPFEMPQHKPHLFKGGI